MTSAQRKQQPASPQDLWHLLRIGVFTLMLVARGAAAAELATATFAGGCFWCMEPPFDKLEGVAKTTVGYTGGQTHNPTYEQVSAGATGHAESIQVTYDSSKVSYSKLLEVFWHNVDPLTPNAQFCDHGSQYRNLLRQR